MSVLNIKDPEAYELAVRIAAATGQTLTKVVIDALAARLRELSAAPATETPDERYEAVMRLVQHWSKHAADPRPVEELLYDEEGLPR